MINLLIDLDSVYDVMNKDFFYRLVKEYTEKEGITEQLKATGQMDRTHKINNIHEE